MSATRYLLASLLLLAVPLAPAFADWQGVPFGITDDELSSYVPDAQPNADGKKDSRGLTASMVAPYVVNDVETDAYFMFDTERRLQEVQLILRNLGDCSSTIYGVASAYGPPEDEADLSGYAKIYHYRDQVNGNLVSVFAPSSPTSTFDCSVSYRPIPTAGEPGGF